MMMAGMFRLQHQQLASALSALPRCLPGAALWGVIHADSRSSAMPSPSTSAAQQASGLSSAALSPQIAASAASASLAPSSSSSSPSPSPYSSSPSARAPSVGHGTRLYNTWRYPKRVFKMPWDVKAVVDAKVAAQPVVPEFVPPTPQPREMTQHSKRVGCIAVKAGMTQAWDEHGVRIPLTVLFVDDCQVVGIKSPERNGYWALQLGAGYRKQKALDMSEAGFFLKQGVPFKHEVAEYRVSEDALLPVGTPITAAHFVAGQHLDVQGVTKGKGFQGVMKRWGFKGQPASHGVSKTHRAPGSIGNRKDPARVWKGKKMPGWMGNDWRTVHNCLLFKVEPKRNLLYVKGQVPGAAGQFVYLRDANSIKREHKAGWGLPFPTYLGDASTLPATVYKTPKNPFRPFSEDADYFPIEWKKGE